MAWSGVFRRQPPCSMCSLQPATTRGQLQHRVRNVGDAHPVRPTSVGTTWAWAMSGRQPGVSNIGHGNLGFEPLSLTVRRRRGGQCWFWQCRASTTMACFNMGVGIGFANTGTGNIGIGAGRGPSTDRGLNSGIGIIGLFNSGNVGFFTPGPALADGNLAASTLGSVAERPALGSSMPAASAPASPTLVTTTRRF